MALKISISKIVISSDNPRKTFDMEKIRELGESILRHGLIHPIIVRPLSNGSFELVTGEMRVRGCLAVGLEEIEASIRELTDVECKVLRLIENVHRNDLIDAEKGDAIIELTEVTGKTYKEIAEKELNVSEKTIWGWVQKANKISEKLRRLTAGGDLTDKHAMSLLKYSHPIQDQLADFIVNWNNNNSNNKINSNNIRNFCKEYDKEPNIKLEDIAKKILGFIPVTTWQPKSKPKPKPKKKSREPLSDSERCIATTKKGKRCGGKRLPNSEYCSQHVFIKRGSKPKPEKKPELKPEEKPKPPEGNGKFDVIYADPPWKYDFDMTERGDPEIQYPTMELEEIKNLKIPSDDNTVLFLWATAPKLADGTVLEVVKAWNFKGKTIMVWDKEIIGMGYYVRSQTEFLIIATKGAISPPQPTDRPSSLLRSRRREHSQKPDEMYELIEKMYPNRKYLELFARPKTKREGWTYWGNEI